MCTITLSYDKNNALARRKLAALLKTGLFEQSSPDQGLVAPTPAKSDTEAHKSEVAEFLYGSKILSSQAFAKHL